MLLFLNLLVNPMFPVQNCYQALAYGLFLILIIPTVFYQPQWGSFSGNGNGFEVNFPISFTQNCYGIASSDTGDVCLAIGIKLLNLNSIQIFGRNLDGTFRTDSNIRCIMVGK